MSTIVPPTTDTQDGPAPYYSDESITLHHGDALKVLTTLPAQSVDCCVTSPPYFGLRDYGEEGQYGLEASPVEYVETMRAVFAEVRRVLADDGTFWLNIGDTRYSGRGASTGRDEKNAARRFGVRSVDKGGADWARPKNLLGIPWRLAFALQDDGWTLRSDIIWAKRNCTPDPANDRPSDAHEHVFLMSKARRYWFDVDAIREDSDPDQRAHNERYAREYAGHSARAATTGQPGYVNNVGIHSRPGKGGRPSRSVWSLSAQPFTDAHFAVMPFGIAERAILAGCKPGGIVLDPFNGSGTTGLAAAKHGRKYVGIDLNRDYLDLSLRTRLSQPGLNFGEASA